VTGARLGGFRGLAVFHPAFVSKVAAFLSLSRAFRGLAVFVHFFLYETCTFLDLAFDTHFGLPLYFFATVTRAAQTTRRALFCSPVPGGLLVLIPEEAAPLFRDNAAPL
jgi:hypothetical protein